MRNSRKSLGALVACVAAIGAVALIGASSASAADATWTPAGGGAKLSGDLTLELNGASPVSCPNVEMVGNTMSHVLVMPWSDDRWWPCASGTVSIRALMGFAYVDNGVYSVEMQNTSGMSPFGSYLGAGDMMTTFTVPFVNASGTAPSQMVFSDTVIGWRQSDMAEISATGVVEVTPPSGPGTVTLVP